MSSAAFRQLLEAGDAPGLRRAWSDLFPDMPQPETDEKAEIVMHMARTGAVSVRFRCRAYSHRWLEERGLPSQLPDDLKPRAERMYPVVAEGVGISVSTRTEWLRPALGEVRDAISDAVEECYASGDTAVPHVRERMAEARDRTLRRLFGRTGEVK